MPVFVIANKTDRSEDEAVLRDILGPAKRAPMHAGEVRAACAPARSDLIGDRQPRERSLPAMSRRRVAPI